MSPGEAPLLRLAEADDARRVFAWRNDPWIVSLSTSRREVSWEEHCRWFPGVLDRDRHLLFLVSGEAGTVRVDRQGEAAVVTIYLLRPFTGRGLGPRALREACREAFRRWPDLARVVAHVRSDNEPSLKAFARVGFVPAGGGEAGCPEGHTAFALHRGSDVSSPDWARDDESTVRYFTRLVEQHGTDPRALDWGSRESQRLRFAVLAGVGPLHGASVLDVGCGQGDLLGWLRETGVDARYAGVDITPPMVEVARRRFPGASFEVRNLLERPPEEGSFDYVLASGLFYLRQSEPLDFLRRMVTALFRACRKGVAFNSLSAWAPQREAGEFYADPAEVLSFCSTLTPRLALRHDYHPRDFSVFLHKREGP